MKHINHYFTGKKGIFTVLAVLILAQALYMCYCFEYKKKDFHSDEIWSYGPANSYEYPFFYVTKDWTNSQNNNEWISGRVIDEYLSVEEGEQFAYHKIYENTSRDLHQPMYFWILNTICSFFVGKFSWWYAFALNLFFFVVGQFFLYLLVEKLFDSRFLAVITCFIYGFSQGAVNNCVYIRMYMMITCLGIISMYLHTVLYKEPSKMKTILPFIWLVTVLGGMTHSFFLAFAGGLSACFCFYYLVKRDWKHLIVYAIVLLSAAGAVFALYPSTVSHAQTYEDRNNIDSLYGGFWFEWRWLLYFMAKEAFALTISPYPSYAGIYLAEILLLAVVIGVPVCFIIRKETFFLNFLNKFKMSIRQVPQQMKHKWNWMLLIMTMSGIILIAVSARMAHIFSMGDLSTRYVFIIYPYLFILLVWLIDTLSRIAFKIMAIVIRKTIPCVVKKSVVIALACGILVRIMFQAATPYYFDYQDDVDLYLAELPKDANYIFALKFPFLLDCLTYPMRGVDNFFATSYYGIFSLKEELEALDSHKEVYLIINTPDINLLKEEDEESYQINEEFDAMQKELTNYENDKVKEYMQYFGDYLMELSICDQFTYIGSSKVFERPVFIFKLRDEK